jgi:hypothetical protein
MCKLCDRKIGNGYAAGIMSQFRPAIDVARKAARPTNSNITAIGGMAVSRDPKLKFDDVVEVATLSTTDQIAAVRELLGRCREFTLVVFETIDNSWPQREVFDLIRARSPEAQMLRINCHNGNAQFWNLSEILRHYEAEEAEAA